MINSQMTCSINDISTFIETGSFALIMSFASLFLIWGCNSNGTVHFEVTQNVFVKILKVALPLHLFN